MANQVLYGYYNRRDLLDQRVTASNIIENNRAVDETIAEHNRQIAAMIALFCQRTTNYSLRFVSPSAARLQPLDENGRARKIKRAGYYDVAFPIQHGGVAWGATYETRVKMTGQEVNNMLATMLSADARWVRDHILAALYYGTSGGSGWSFTDPSYGALTIKGLANGDTDTYVVASGADAGATDTHILGQAAAIADNANPYDDIYNELTEHPENGGDVIALIPTSLKATTMALTNFIDKPDMNIELGNSATKLVREPDIVVPGTFLGYTDGVYVYEWKSLPDDYIVATTTDGEKALAMREEPEAELQGFNREGQRSDHPFYEDQYARRAGFGAWNRVGAVIMRVGNATYALPTGYDSPMP